MDERAILEFYRLQTLFPNEWPAENNSDASDSEDEVKKKMQRRKSRYQALERTPTRRSLTGTEPSGIGGARLLKDEPDPLGTTDSVVRTLRHLGMPVQDNPRIRMSSTNPYYAFPLTPPRQPLPPLLDDLHPLSLSLADPRQRR